MSARRRPSLVAPLAAVLALALAFAAPQMPAAHGVAVRPPAVQIGVLSTRDLTRWRRRLARAVAIALRLFGGGPGRVALRARGQKLFPRMPFRDAYPRGPPPKSHMAPEVSRAAVTPPGS
jgi:hypothetical protein